MYDWYKSCAIVCSLLCVLTTVSSAQIRRFDQGEIWTSYFRSRHHHLDQGSRLISVAWLNALTQPNGEPFLADQLKRYGFIVEDGVGFPIGVSIAPTSDGPMAGFTCAACHTREIKVKGQAWHIEGAPAFVDLQTFLADLDASVLRVLKDKARFATFADNVVGAKPEAREALLQSVRLWSVRFHAYANALAGPPWGPARLDAFGLIFNQLAGLDVGEGPSSLIAENIVKADAPVRYPFLWNAPFQDKTDWPGFAENGDDRAALARNISEVLGVFAKFRPKPSKPGAALNRDYLAENSEDVAALEDLETGIAALKAPAWPWPINKALVTKGKAIFERSIEEGGCAECHGIKQGADHGRPTFATPVLDVGTDTKLWRKLSRSVRTGVMAGAIIPGEAPLSEEDEAARLLRMAVVGILVQATANQQVPTDRSAASTTKAAPANLGVLHPVATQAKSTTPNAYEARVLFGAWAAAPYLHNGSIPTLADLLRSAPRRPRHFAVGPVYDISKVGLALDQAPGTFMFEATSCEAVDSGNSNCGHEYGTRLTEQEKLALIEYLKSL